MKKIINKLVGIALTILLVTFVLPVYSLGANVNENLQIVETEEGDYIVYLKDINKEFKYAISDKKNATEMELHYDDEKEDQLENKVALITKTKYEEIKNNAETFLYIKEQDNTVTIRQLDFAQAFTTKNMETVENTTKRIETTLVKDLLKKDVEENGVKVKVTVGGLIVKENKNSNYYYSITKLPAEKYSRLQELADIINNKYATMSMYEKIEISKEFYNLYTELKENQNWKEVENSTIMQPEDAVEGEQYIVFLKETDENGNEKAVDVKFMTSYRADKEENEQGQTETKVVKETTKLPITGESIALFVILAIVIVAIIIVFIRMKKLQNKKINKEKNEIKNI